MKTLDTQLHGKILVKAAIITLTLFTLYQIANNLCSYYFQRNAPKEDLLNKMMDDRYATSCDMNYNTT